VFDGLERVDIAGGDRTDRDLEEILAFPEIVLQRAERYASKAGDAPHREAGSPLL